MEKESLNSNKELLLKDLCSRLPYGVKGVNKAEIVTDPSDWYCGFVRMSKELENRICFSDWKPYLFPLSNMTEEQNEEYCSLQQKVIYNSKGPVNSDVMEYVNWCYKNHIDINGLIPMGLANDATNLNIY